MLRCGLDGWLSGLPDDKIKVFVNDPYPRPATSDVKVPASLKPHVHAIPKINEEDLPPRTREVAPAPKKDESVSPPPVSPPRVGPFLQAFKAAPRPGDVWRPQTTTPSKLKDRSSSPKSAIRPLPPGRSLPNTSQNATLSYEPPTRDHRKSEPSREKTSSSLAPPPMASAIPNPPFIMV
jgi:hypothetical protein